MSDEAARLARQQRDERGLVANPFDPKKGPKVVGPYVPTPEHEARAARILQLRRAR